MDLFQIAKHIQLGIEVSSQIRELNHDARKGSYSTVQVAPLPSK